MIFWGGLGILPPIFFFSHFKAPMTLVNPRSLRSRDPCAPHRRGPADRAHGLQSRPSGSPAQDRGGAAQQVCPHPVLHRECVGAGSGHTTGWILLVLRSRDIHASLRSGCYLGGPLATQQASRQGGPLRGPLRGPRGVPPGPPRARAL